jgi:hypothetical protein
MFNFTPAADASKQATAAALPTQQCCQRLRMLYNYSCLHSFKCYLGALVTIVQHLRICLPHAYHVYDRGSCRNKYGIKRGLDGRVQLRRRSGSWVSVRLDMEVPGAILLRDTKTEQVFALETDSLPQVRSG